MGKDKMNTIFSIHKVYQYKNHIIRAEKRSLFFTMEYSLIIDDIKQDQIFGLYGILVLHGSINDDGVRKPVKIVMKQKVFKTVFYCVIDGEFYKMNNYQFHEFK